MATPTTAASMQPRMLLVYGSQTQTCKRIASKMSTHWKDKGVVAVCDVFDGNTLSHETEDLAQLKDNYDVLVVITSSFGDGEPPDNYTNFLLKILQAAEDGSKPLEGMQHAVLGEGSSVYQETFQNCPRLTDKYLEECGSRRFFARHETDVGGEEDEEVSRNLFRNGVAEILLKGLPKATTAAAAAWAKPRQSHGEPTDQIKVHSVESLGGGRGQTTMQILVPLTVAVIGVGSFCYLQFFAE